MQQQDYVFDAVLPGSNLTVAGELQSAQKSPVNSFVSD